MKHRIVVLGAGYAGAFSAGFLARQLHTDDVEITVVNAEPDFVERLRLHQLAAGHELPHRPLTEIFAGTGIRLRVARVVELDVDRRRVTLDDGGRLGYDTLLYALGSTVADHGVPGVADHTYNVAGRPSALRLRARLRALGSDGDVLVVGGNLTAIEAATEIAEAHPDLRVTLATSGEVGGWLGPKARKHLLRAFDRLGITVHENTTIERVEPSAACAADDTVFGSDATVWAAGFAVHPIAAASGLAVRPNGQITADRELRSVSHPNVFVAGDSAFVIGGNGQPLPMSCASAGFTGQQATATIIGELTGRPVKRTSLSYVGNHVSLGRADAIFQFVDGDARAKPGALCGRPAVWVKSAIVGTSGWAISRPTFGRLDHHYRTRADAGSPGVVAA
ncbi:NAD(P)/FAD-dependent oxidoreductase [Nocardia caishijiensis]|uniref:NADH dehydrogenase FAD-containing subunit n=1 Tax=Nocardia caishijiensis TaxID=184756 RepID=A0ABQ6YM13_9NOCA|nr:FAD-dependent oxidoreductase [Nocardia caishijiensis]KAF0846803.1 NADH dehydrogenase FAD-containing subunit [Nocardia caishijiensis]